MAKGHSTKERKLLDDIRVKNTQRKKLDRLEYRSLKFELVLGKSKKRAKTTRLKESISRYQAAMKELTEDVVRRNRDLVPRIREELKVSEQEVKDWQEKYRKELAETEQSRKDLEKAREERPSKELPAGAILRRIARLERKIEREKKEDAAVQKEIASEAGDKIKLNLELRRAAAELACYAGE